MILHEICGSETHPAYQALAVSNGNRQYDFLGSIITASLAVDRPFLSSAILKALNYHAIACLHVNAGEYRPCPIKVDEYYPPEHYLVQALMDDFVNSVNRNWDRADPLALASLVLWKLNYIHPFINGNGRTARAAAYFVLCVKIGALLPGVPILPVLIHQNRDRYVEALKALDESYNTGALDITPLVKLLEELLQQQLASAEVPAD